jgi:hypothetical protein
MSRTVFWEEVEEAVYLGIGCVGGHGHELVGHTEIACLAMVEIVCDQI